MKIRIDKNELTRVLNIVSGVVDKNPTLPVLTNILFVAQGDTLTITASNGDVSTQTQTTKNLTIQEDGSALIGGATITSAIAKLSGNIDLETKNNQIKVSSTKVNYTLNITEPSAYPTIDFARSDSEFNVNGNSFTQALNKVINSVATSGERPIFTGVNMVANGSELVFTSTDSYRLSKSSLETNIDNLNVTILASTLRSIMKIAKDNELFISTNGRNAIFRTDDTIFVTRLVDGLYPDTTRLVPQDFNTHITVEREELIKSVDRASFMKEDNVWILNLNTKDDILELTTKSQEIGTTFEALSVEVKGTPISINLNGKYLLDALRSLEDDKVTFNLVGELQALTVSDTTNQTQLLLPVRTFN